MAFPNEIRAYDANALRRTTEGLSGATLVGATPPAGRTATTVQGLLDEINAAAGLAPATPTTLGTIKLSKAAPGPNNPVVPEDTDPRLSDARTPTSHAASHEAGGSDPVSPTSIGAAANDDARLKTLQDEGVSLTDRALLDFVGSGVIVEDDSAGGKTKVTISGAADCLRAPP